MNTLAGLTLTIMQAADIDEVVATENLAYPFPWTRGNFIDSLASNYDCRVMRDADGLLAGYFLLMPAVDENHILNITVRPDLQGKGLGRMMLDQIAELTRQQGMPSILLEVRPSNTRALAVYLHMGFEQIGIRKNYYPAGEHTREDAIVMRWML